VASAVIGAGGVIEGGVVSTTDTVKEELALFPVVSEALHETVVVPSANVPPDAGRQVTTTAPSTISVAVGAV
jgi:hypothetical protein